MCGGLSSVEQTRETADGHVVNLREQCFPGSSLASGVGSFGAAALSNRGPSFHRPGPGIMRVWTRTQTGHGMNERAAGLKSPPALSPHPLGYCCLRLVLAFPASWGTRVLPPFMSTSPACPLSGRSTGDSRFSCITGTSRHFPSWDRISWRPPVSP